MFYLYLLALAGGYALSIFTWPKIKLWMNGAETEIAALEAKAKAIKAAV